MAAGKSKEMTVNCEILLAGAYYQLSEPIDLLRLRYLGACNIKTLTELADLMPNTSTPSLGSDLRYESVSFHITLTFRLPKRADTANTAPPRIGTGAKRCLCNLTTVWKRSYPPFP
jgi:hypothetical protein